MGIEVGINVEFIRCGDKQILPQQASAVAT